MPKKQEKLCRIEVEARKRIADALIQKAGIPIMFVTGSPVYCGKLDFKTYRDHFPNSQDAYTTYLLLKEQRIDEGLPSIIAEICLEEGQLAEEVEAENYTSAARIRNKLEELYLSLSVEANARSHFLKRGRERGRKSRPD